MDKVIKNFQNISYGPAPEDSKEVNSWIKNLKNPNNHFINGKFVKSSSSKKLNIINPSTNKKIATLSVASKKDVNAAVSAAKKAYSSWAFSSKDERIKLLEKLPDPTIKDREELRHYRVKRDCLHIELHKRLKAFDHFKQRLDADKTIRETLTSGRLPT